MKKNISTWQEVTRAHEYKGELAKESETDVVVVGGGMAGVLAAYEISKAGKKVTLLEKGKLGEGATLMTTAFLTQMIDTDMTDLVSGRGAQEAARILSSHGKAIDEIEKIVKEEKIECDFERCSNFVYARNEEEDQGMMDEVEAMKEAGLDAEYEKGGDFGFPVYSHIGIKNQAKFHPLKFLQSLAVIALEHGASIVEETEVDAIEGDGPYLVITSDGKKIKAPWVIVNTYQPLNQPLSLFFKKGMYVSYVFELKIREGKIPEGIYEDTLNPYHYFRIDGDRMIVGGEDHREEIPIDESKNFQALEDYVKETFPGIEYEIERKWSGPILEPIDGLAFIGPLDDGERVLYSMAFSGNGMTYSAIAAMMHRDAVLGKKSEWADLYPASRLSRGKLLAIKGRDYVGELIGGALKNSFKYRKKK